MRLAQRKYISRCSVKPYIPVYYRTFDCSAVCSSIFNPMSHQDNARSHRTAHRGAFKIPPEPLNEIETGLSLVDNIQNFRKVGCKMFFSTWKYKKSSSSSVGFWATLKSGSKSFSKANLIVKSVGGIVFCFWGTGVFEVLSVPTGSCNFLIFWDSKKCKGQNFRYFLSRSFQDNI